MGTTDSLKFDFYNNDFQDCHNSMKIFNELLLNIGKNYFVTPFKSLIVTFIFIILSLLKLYF